jgi:hypothetical protein
LGARRILSEFDNLARPITRRINYAAAVALPISFRPALSAGLTPAIACTAFRDVSHDMTTREPDLKLVDRPH